MTVRKGTSIDCNVKEIYFSFPHLLTFGETAVDLWNVSSSLTHVAVLSEWIDYPVERGIVIDASRGLVIIPQCDRPVGLWVYSLHDGRLVKKVGLFGRISVARIQYDSGRVLVGVDDGDETWVLVCDVSASTGPVFRTEITGSSLTSEGAERRFLGFRPAWLSGAGEVVAWAGEEDGEGMALMLWPPNDAHPPSQCARIARTLDEEDAAVDLGWVTGVGDDRLVMCTAEAVLGVTIWASGLISGHVRVLRYIMDVVVAIGYGPGYVSITVLDASTGQQRRHERVNAAVRVCDVSTQGDVVAVLCDGGVLVSALDKFITDGFPAVARPFGFEFGEWTHGGVGDGYAVVVEDNQKVSLLAW